MKKLAVLLCALGALAAYGQTPGGGNVLQAPASPPPTLVPPPKPNEIVRSNITYSGIAVLALKAQNPLQLVNPAAPPQYGSPADNVDRDFAPGRSFGLKLFSIRF
ncbi:MAG TPA: hypothetical protein VMU04_14315 [Candidatus Acidoferrum sp.]|nr:hypothetical protein [Candidatus Acidoferrum sp.]